MLWCKRACSFCVAKYIRFASSSADVRFDATVRTGAPHRGLPRSLRTASLAMLVPCPEKRTFEIGRATATTVEKRCLPHKVSACECGKGRPHGDNSFRSSFGTGSDPFPSFTGNWTAPRKTSGFPPQGVPGSSTPFQSSFHSRIRSTACLDGGCAGLALLFAWFPVHLPPSHQGMPLTKSGPTPRRRLPYRTRKEPPRNSLSHGAATLETLAQGYCQPEISRCGGSAKHMPVVNAYK